MLDENIITKLSILENEIINKIEELLYSERKITNGEIAREISKMVCDNYDI